MTSLWEGRVGMPVEGPPRMTSTTTQGASIMAARPRFSCLSEKPGPEVAVMARAPPMEAPVTAAMEAISSSIWMKTPPTLGSSRAMCSAISEEGVMG